MKASVPEQILPAVKDQYERYPYPLREAAE